MSAGLILGIVQLAAGLAGAAVLLPPTIAMIRESRRRKHEQEESR